MEGGNQDAYGWSSCAAAETSGGMPRWYKLAPGVWKCHHNGEVCRWGFKKPQHTHTSYHRFSCRRSLITNDLLIYALLLLIYVCLFWICLVSFENSLFLSKVSNFSYHSLTVGKWLKNLFTKISVALCVTVFQLFLMNKKPVVFLLNVSLVKHDTN